MDTHADVYGELFAVAVQRIVRELIVYSQQGVRHRIDLVTNRKLSPIYLNTYHKWCVTVADGKPRFRSFLVHICYVLFLLPCSRLRYIFFICIYIFILVPDRNLILSIMIYTNYSSRYVSVVRMDVRIR
jgi:hypothetical protein